MSKQYVVDELNAKREDAPSSQSQALAAAELRTAWADHKRNGLEFGRVCSEWRTKFKAQGTHTDASFSGILKSLDIPRHIADYWADQYEFKTGKHSLALRRSMSSSMAQSAHCLSLRWRLLWMQQVKM